MILPNFDYYSPVTLDEATGLLHDLGENSMIFAGGTDVFVPMSQGGMSTEHLIDLKHIPDLDRIYYDEEGLHIGCLAKLYDIQTSTLVLEKNPSIAQAAKYVASTQIRHKGTMMGNLCAAVPSCDCGPILLAQNAVIRVKGQERDYELPADQFFAGVKKNNLRHGDIAVEIVVPPLQENEYAAYIKFASRKAMDLAMVGTAVKFRLENNVFTSAQIALGAVAPTPILAPKAAEVLVGHEMTDDLLELCGAIAMDECDPISDVRASAEYRSDMVRVFVKRTIRKALEGYKGGLA